MLKNQRGFTILELLVVIVVIGVLAGLVLSVFGNIQERSQAAKIQSVVDQYSKALVNYKTDNGEYPDPSLIADNNGAYQACLGTGYTNDQCVSSVDWIDESNDFHDLLEPYIGEAPDIDAATFDANFGMPIEVRGAWLSLHLEGSNTLDGEDVDFWTIGYAIPVAEYDCTGGAPLNTNDFSTWTTATTQRHVLTSGSTTYCEVLLP